MLLPLLKRRLLLHAVLMVAAILLAASSISAQTPPAAGLPIILAHGFCSSSAIWGDDDGLIHALQPPPSGSPRFGWGVTKLYARNNIAGAPFLPIAIQADTQKFETELDPTLTASYRLFTIDFVNESFPGSLMQDIFVNDTGIAHKAAELATVIQAVTRLSGVSKAILIGHSLGGLAARAYVQGRASWDGVSFVEYRDDVAQIIMIDTPNRGSAWANVDASLPEYQCMSESSRDKDDLAIYKRETDNPFLWYLNAAPPITDVVRTAAIVSYSSYVNKSRGDGIVGYASQNLKKISPYDQPGYEYVVDYNNPIPTLDLQFHTKIYKKPETIALVQTLLQGFDSTSDLFAPATTLNGTISSTQSRVRVKLTGTRFTPGGIVRVFSLRPGDTLWAKFWIQEIRADRSGQVQMQWNVSCTETPGVWSVRARDESAWLKGDFNGDGIVNSIDFSLLSSKWLTSDAFIDLNYDALVNSVDYSILNRHWFVLGGRGRVTPILTFDLTPPPCL